MSPDQIPLPTERTLTNVQKNSSGPSSFTPLQSVGSNVNHTTRNRKIIRVAHRGRRQIVPESDQLVDVPVTVIDSSTVIFSNRKRMAEDETISVGAAKLPCGSL